MKDNISRLFTIYAFLTIFSSFFLAFIDVKLAVLDICIAFVVFGVLSVVYRKNRGLNIDHLFIVAGIIGIFISSVLLFMDSSTFANFIEKYGIILQPIAFIFIPLYVFYVVPLSQYKSIMKTDHLEVIGTCVGYNMTSEAAGATIRGSLYAYTPVFEIFLDGKKKKVHSNHYTSYKTVKKYYPIGTKTKVLINKEDYNHFLIMKTEEDRKRIPLTVIIFVTCGIISMYLLFKNVFFKL